MNARSCGVMIGMLTLLVLSISRRAGAQSRIPLSLELQTGFVVPFGAIDQRWGLGQGLGITAAAEPRPNTVLYAGYTFSYFDIGFTSGVKAIAAGPSVGVRRSFLSGDSPVAPWVQGGLLLHMMDVQGDAATGRDHGLGFELGAGVERTDTSPRLRASAGILYRQFNARILRPEREKVASVSLLAGFRFRF